MLYLAKKKLRFNKLLYISAIILGISVNSKLFSSTFNKRIDNSFIANESKSFITKAIEKSGPAVVTIDTQRLVKPNKISITPNILKDPYFEKLFGLTSL